MYFKSWPPCSAFISHAWIVSPVSQRSGDNQTHPARSRLLGSLTSTQQLPVGVPAVPPASVSNFVIGPCIPIEFLVTLGCSPRNFALKDPDPTDLFFGSAKSSSGCKLKLPQLETESVSQTNKMAIDRGGDVICSWTQAGSK